MSTTARNRVPSGMTTGGQYTHTPRPEADLDLQSELDDQEANWPGGDFGQPAEDDIADMLADHEVFLSHLTPEQKGIAETERRSAHAWATGKGAANFAGPNEAEAFSQWTAQQLPEVDFDPSRLPAGQERLAAWHAHQAAVVAHAVAEGPQEHEWVTDLQDQGLAVPPVWRPQERFVVLGFADRLRDAGLQVASHTPSPGAEVLTLSPLTQGGAAAA